ncbi:unannotated protein [freshwater metagenome]|uniref:Unannotated protein n=1 Tax=freshwater metagenome TaxID=449393 RepID=A0A6J7DPY2_9ZZZZ
MEPVTGYRHICINHSRYVLHSLGRSAKRARFLIVNPRSDFDCLLCHHSRGRYGTDCVAWRSPSLSRWRGCRTLSRGSVRSEQHLVRWFRHRRTCRHGLSAALRSHQRWPSHRGGTVFFEGLRAGGGLVAFTYGPSSTRGLAKNRSARVVESSENFGLVRSRRSCGDLAGGHSSPRTSPGLLSRGRRRGLGLTHAVRFGTQCSSTRRSLAPWPLGSNGRWHGCPPRGRDVVARHYLFNHVGHQDRSRSRRGSVNSGGWRTYYLPWATRRSQ